MSKPVSEGLRPASLSIDWKRLRFLAFWVFGLGLLCHGYSFLNGNFSHDSLYSIWEPGPFLMLSVGRYGRAIYRLVRGNFALPLFGGFLSLCYLTVTAYLLTDILALQKKSFQAITCGILVSNSTMALLNATYLHDTDAYCFSLLLAVLGVWLAQRCRYGSLLSIVLYGASLSIYQAFLNAAIYLWLFLALMALLDGEKPGAVFGKLALRMLTIAAAMGLYYLGYLTVLAVTGIEPNSYSTIGSVKLDIASLLVCLQKLLETERDWFFHPVGNRSGLLLGINLAMTGLSFLALGALAVKKRLRPAAWLLGLFILALMPMGMDAIALVSDTYHMITIYPLFLTYPLMLSVLERYLALPGKSLKGSLCVLLLGVMLFDNSLYSNTLSLKKELESRQTLSIYTRILEKMEQTQGYVPGQTPVVIVGAFPSSFLNTQREGFDSSSTGLTVSVATTYYGTMENYFHYYLGDPTCFGDGDDQWLVENSEEMFQMPLYPAPGSIRIIEGILVIKLS